MKPHVALFCLLAFALAVLGCADSMNPAAPGDTAIRAVGIDGEREAGMTHVQPIMLPLADGAKAIVDTTAVVPANLETTLKIEYSYRAVSGRIVWIKAWLKIDAGALPEDTEITMAFDESMTGVNFYPEGLEFLIPARLDFSAQNLDQMRPGEKKLFYMKETEYGPVYYQMADEELTVDDLSGHINLKKGEIPHFSRYVFGRVYGRDDVK